jgi:hypothetical protein
LDHEPANLPLSLEPCDASALRDLLAQRGDAALDVDDARELLGSLIELRDAENGTSDPGDQSGLLHRSLVVGETVLHAPNLAARIRMLRLDRADLPADWAEYAEEYVALCVGWLLAHCYERETIALWNAETAQALVEGWAVNLTCTSHELSEAVADLTHNGYPPMPPEAPSRKKDLVRPTPPLSWLAWPTRFPAARAITGCMKSLKRMCIGCAKRLRTALRNAKRGPTPADSTPKTPASTPASATSESGEN